VELARRRAVGEGHRTTAVRGTWWLDLIGAAGLVLLGSLVTLVPQRFAARDRRQEMERERNATEVRAVGAAQAAMICELQVAVKGAIGSSIGMLTGSRESLVTADRELLEAVSVIELAKGRVGDHELIELADAVTTVVMRAAAASDDEVGTVIGDAIGAGREFSDRVRTLLVDLPPPDPPQSLFGPP